MGACATKSKVLKNDAGDVPAPEPAPETAKEEATVGGTVSESTVDVENGSDRKAIEIVDHDEKVDSNARSLGLLFKQNEGKDTTENEKSKSDQVEKQEKSETEKPPEEKASETTQLEEEQHCDSVSEKTTIPDAVHPHQNTVETKKVIQINTSEEKITKENEPENGEEASEEKKVEVINDPTKIENAEKGAEKLS